MVPNLLLNGWMNHRIALVLTLMVFFSGVSTQSYAAGNVTVRPHVPVAPKMSFDEYMLDMVAQIQGEPIFSSDVNPQVEVHGILVLPISTIEISKDPERFKQLYETGIWESPNGAIYNFRKVSMTFPDGRGGIPDAAALWFGKTRLQFSPNPPEPLQQYIAKPEVDVTAEQTLLAAQLPGQPELAEALLELHRENLRKASERECSGLLSDSKNFKS